MKLTGMKKHVKRHGSRATASSGDARFDELDQVVEELKKTEGEDRWTQEERVSLAP
jgi:hypothetical protein